MPRADWTPTTKQVAVLLRARTKTRNDAEQEDFTDATTPSKKKVEGLTEGAMDELVPAFGATIPDSLDPDDPDALRNGAKRCAALRTAMDVESSFRPEQARADRSQYELLEKRFESLRKTLLEAISEASAGGGDGESVVAGGNYPSGAFGSDSPITMNRPM